MIRMLRPLYFLIFILSISIFFSSFAFSHSDSSYYDLRRVVPSDRNSEYNPKLYLGKIHDQGDFETCWAYAAIEAIEYQMRKHYIAKGEFNKAKNVAFSHRYLAWTGYLAPGDIWANSPFAKSKKEFFKLGGDLFTAAHAIMQYGLIEERHMPWKGNRDKDNHVKEIVQPVLRIHDVIYKPGTFYNNIQEIKALLRKYGAADITINRKVIRGAFFADKKETVLNPNLKEIDSDHGTTLIGYDDNFKIKIKGKNYQGAWIIHDSSGDDIGENGYLYILYADKAIKDFMVYIPEFDLQRYSRYISSFGPHTEPLTYPILHNKHIKSLIIANNYTVTSAQDLKAIGLFVGVDNAQYRIEIYEAPYEALDENNDGKLLHEQEGFFGKKAKAGESNIEEGLAGYRIIDLSKPIPMPKNKEVSVLVQITAPKGQNIRFVILGNVLKRTKDDNGAIAFDDEDLERLDMPYFTGIFTKYRTNNLN